MSADPKEWSFIAGITPESRDRVSADFVDAQMAFSTPRRFMGLLRDLMAKKMAADEKLDCIVEMIAKELRADACACFILRAGEVLEFFSSSGFPAELTHNKRVQVGVGVVGDIAAHATPIVVQDFSLSTQYQPGPVTGAGKYKAFCGVPVLRGGRVRGVLSVQNVRARYYGEEVVEILQTVAMVVAELIVAGGIVSRLEMSSGDASGDKPSDVEGVSLGRGLAIGTAVLYEPSLVMQDIVANDSKEQKQRLREALNSMHDAIDRMLNRNAIFNGSESRDILEAYQMFAKDRGWLAKIEMAIDKGLSAEAAVQRVQNETRARMMQVSDTYIRERLHDLEDLSNRLLSHLMRQDMKEVRQQTGDIVLIARSLGPAALLDYDRNTLKGVILEKGSHSNHVAIVARALGIPIVGQCGDVRNFIVDGDQVIVDGDHGMVYISPSDYVVELYTNSIEARARRSTQYRSRVQKDTITKDGVKISVMVNAGLIEDIKQVNYVDAEGVGLFRTELSFMGFKKYPLVSTQVDMYSKILDELGDKPIMFRTLDIGGDKPLPYFRPPEEEENPALGWRAVRIGMDRPAVLRTQLRALMKSARHRPLKIMIPFVTEVSEFIRVQELLEMEKKRAKDRGYEIPKDIELGVMLEVPALVWQLDSLLKIVDFVSVGSNDLMQYLYAVDRGSYFIRGRYDALSPALLKVLKYIADTCKAANKPFSICGELAGEPLGAMVLIALGYTTLSVPVQSVEAVKMMVPTLDTRQLLPYLDTLMQSQEHSLRERLMFFARDHSVDIFQTV